MATRKPKQTDIEDPVLVPGSAEFQEVASPTIDDRVLGRAPELAAPYGTNGLHVYSAIQQVIRSLSKTGISKDNENKEQNFKFRSIDAFLAALSLELPKANLVILPRLVSREIHRHENQSKKIVTTVYVTMDYDLVSTIDGSQHTVSFSGEGRDNSDKSANKATSGAYKYMAIQTFCVPVVGQEDPDFESPEDGGAEQAEPERKRAPRVEPDKAVGQKPAATKAGAAAKNAPADPVEAKLVASIKNEARREKLRGKLLEAYGVMVVEDIPDDLKGEAVLKIDAFLEAVEAKAKAAAK